MFYDGSVMQFNLSEKFQYRAIGHNFKKVPHNLINTMAAVSAVYLAGAKLEKHPWRIENI